MTRKEEIREEALDPRTTPVELIDLILELTAPESSPAPLESQEELIDEIIQFTNQKKRKYSETVDFLRQFHLTRRTEGGQKP